MTAPEIGVTTPSKGYVLHVVTDEPLDDVDRDLLREQGGE
jgi:hypothetical protein